MKKIVLSLLLVLSLLAGATVALAGAGGSDDPLVSLSQAKSWASSLVSKAETQAKTDLNGFGSGVLQAAKKQTVVYPAVHTLTKGGTMTLETGSSVVLTSGAASVSVSRGNLVNASVGAAASNGALNKNQQYIVCENSSVTITARENSAFLVTGSVKTTGGVSAGFADVAAGIWYESYVNRGVELGLIHGSVDSKTGKSVYNPDSNLSVAEAITLAAQIHCLNKNGNSNIASSGNMWYDKFRTYCITNGIIDSKYGSYTDAQMQAPISRGEFVHIFYHALPAEQYSAKNQITDNAIPDVKSGSTYASEIYTFYRAGILGGFTNTPGYADHSFGFSTDIRRSEVAVIVVHMMDADTRISFTLT